jgi:hypothetical protein
MSFLNQVSRQVSLPSRIHETIHAPLKLKTEFSSFMFYSNRDVFRYALSSVRKSSSKFNDMLLRASIYKKVLLETENKTPKIIWNQWKQNK